jgi:hypothetical protein
VNVKLRRLHSLVPWLIAALVSAIVCFAAGSFFGYLVPTWIYGPSSGNAPHTAEVFSISLSFATVYSLLGFILLTLFLHRKLAAKHGPY